MTTRLVTVGRYRNAIDAELAKGALESAGIRAQIPIQTHNVAVDEGDAETAEQIVNAMIGIAHAEHVEWSDAAPAEAPQRCEQCGSPEVERRKKVAGFALFALLVLSVGFGTNNTMAAFFVCVAGLVFFLAADSWRCRQCGATW
jgi:hypothetical protein